MARPFGATFTVDGSWMQPRLGEFYADAIVASGVEPLVTHGHTSCFLWDHGPVTSRVWSEAWT